MSGAPDAHVSTEAKLANPATTATLFEPRDSQVLADYSKTHGYLGLFETVFLRN